MAATRIMPLHVGKGRTESQVISDGEQAEIPHKEQLRMEIDITLQKKPEFWEVWLQKNGCSKLRLYFFIYP